MPKLIQRLSADHPAAAATEAKIESAIGNLVAQVAASAATRDRERRLPYAEIAAIRATGFLAARLPSPWGTGAGTGFVTRILMLLGRADPNVTQALLPHLSFVDKLLVHANSTDQARWFPRIAAGELITNAVAESAGQRVGDLATTLRATANGGYVLNGTKAYATGSLFAQWLYITGLLDGGGSIQVVVPADRAGIEILDDWDAAGQRTTSSGTVVLRDVAVGADEVLEGSRQGGVRNYIGASSQLHHAAMDTGIALAALDDAITLARDHGRPVPESGVERGTDDFYVQHTVGEIAIIAHGAQALTERAAAVLDGAIAGFHAGTASDDDLVAASIAVAEAKAAANVASLRTSEMLFAVAGARGALRDHNLDRHWRNARTHTLHDPVAYKYKAIGNYLLNGTKPPISAKY